MNNKIPSISQLIRIGFFVGIGFSIPLTIFTYAPMYFMEGLMLMDFNEEYDDYVEFSQTESGLEATITKNNKIENGWVFLGTLKNAGDHEWKSATVQIELFNEEGGFIDESDGYIQGAIDPGTDHHFKVTFHSCDEEKEIVFSDFKISVTGAY